MRISYIFIPIFTIALALCPDCGLGAQPVLPEDFLVRYETHPLQDLYKAVHQDTFGPGHLIDDLPSAKKSLSEELETIPDERTESESEHEFIDFHEPAGPFGNYCRIKLRAVRMGIISADELIDAVVESARKDERGVIPAESLSPEEWRKRWNGVVKQMSRHLANGPAETYLRFVEDSSRIAGMLAEHPDSSPVVHHSDTYIHAEKPHYRIVRKDIFERDFKEKFDTTEVVLKNVGFSSVTTGRDYFFAEEIFADLVRAREKTRLTGRHLTRAEMMILAAERLLGTPYIAGTQDVRNVPKNAWAGDKPEQERMRIYLTKTDCILFVETCLGFATTAYVHDNFDSFSYEWLAAEILQTRYRSFSEKNYFDRIHYTTEWLRKLESRKILKDLTLELGGSAYNHPIHFMSRHPEHYWQMSGTDSASVSNRREIRKIEEVLNKQPMTYIPKEKIKSIEREIRSGDIVCFVSKVEGLDIAHVAMACVTKDKVGFIHASMTEGKVVVDKQSIADYTLGRKSLAGIKVVRPL